MEKIPSILEFKELCRQCAEECKSCAEQCKELPGMDKFIISCYDWESACLQVILGENLTESLIQQCLEACETCYDTCKLHPHDICTSCAEFCHRCIQAGKEIEWTYLDFNNDTYRANSTFDN
jgi:hypothetical protein